MKQLLRLSLVLFNLMIIDQSVKAGLAYPDPPGGWTYTYNGDLAAFGTGSFDALDGTWSRSNGSSEWDGSAIGGIIDATNKPGGAMSITESNVTYLRIQDPGRPSDYSGTNNGCGGCSLANPSNRKIVFAHDMTAEGAQDTVLDDGFTFTFRARIPTPSNTSAPLDPLYPNGEGANGPQPYPAGGDGFVIADNAYGYFTVRQLAGGKVGFSLTVSNDTAGGLNTTPKANYQGVSMNGLNGTTLNNNVDFGEAPPQFLSIDPTEWIECWIVLRKDDSGLGTHTAFIYANGSLSPQIFHLTAANAGETVYNSMSFFALAMSTTAQMGAVDVDFVAYKFAAVFPAGSGGLPPVIANVSPTPPTQGNLFYPATNGISFTASSAASSTIPSSGIVLFLNGVNVSNSLIITGPNTNLTVRYDGLVDNTIYSGRITVTDSAGQSASFPLLFDTFTEANSVVVEAEDYNYDSGKFTDKPAPNGYAGFTGTPEVDFHDVTPSSLGDYRITDAVDTRLSTDTTREQFGLSDYDVSLLEQGEWMNYTRTFPVGKYNVYLRCASQVAQSIRLDLVTGPTSNQALDSLGTFSATNSGAAHTYARLGDAFGNPLVVNLSGVRTLRLTAPDASINLQLNYLVFAPAAGAGANPPVVAFASPGPNSTNLLPDAPIRVGIANRDTAVVLTNMTFFFDGADVTGSAVLSSNPSGASVTYRPPDQLALNSTHTNRLVFSDGTQTFTNQWTFKVANLPVLLATWATPPGSGLINGFNVQIHKARNGAQNLLFPNTVTRAESQLADLLNDADTGRPFVNEAAGPDSNGLFAETNVINYSQYPASQGGADSGTFPGDQSFPYINPADYNDDPNHIAMAVRAYLELSAGLQHFGVRRDDGFKLAAGPDFTASAATVVLGSFEPAGGVETATATTEFDFVVQTNGVYPVRLVFFENSGGADLEWYSVDRTSSVATLINDPTASAPVKAYMARTAPITNPLIVNPTLMGGTFQFSCATVLNRTYFVEYKDSLSDATWQFQPGIAGDGSVKSFSAPANVSSARFYRIRAQ